MDLNFNTNDIENYHSNCQIARILTERWVKDNMYCPHCGSMHINQFENNRPVADFYCPYCDNQYELKSKNGILGTTVNDGAYDTMIQRITSNQNPDFFFMSYSKENYSVSDLVLVPKHFFVPEIIEKRKPLAEAAKRAGWVGCNIIISKVPEQGRINIIKNGEVNDTAAVIKKVNDSNRLKVKDINNRGWIMDILNCVNRVETNDFSLDEMYSFEEELQSKHLDNHNVRPKIRQQLQYLRDKGFIEFLGNGKYRKVIQ